MEWVDGTALLEQAAMEWISAHTSFLAEPGGELPARVQLFIRKFAEVMRRTDGVTSEQLAGMSQSFDGSGSGAILDGYARELLAPWYAANRFVPAERKWD